MMNKKLIITLLVFSTLLLGGCNFLGFNKNNSKGDNNSNDNKNDEPFEREYDQDQKSDDGNYTIDAAKSNIVWKVRGNDNQMNTGNVKLKSGQATVEEGSLKTADILVDMNSLIADEGKVAVANYIKGSTYFNVAANPEVAIKIIKVERIPEDPDDMLNYEVTAEITIKGQTQEESFDASIIEIGDNVISLKAEVDMNMKNYGTADNAAPEAMKNSFEMNLDLYFNPGV